MAFTIDGDNSGLHGFLAEDGVQDGLLVRNIIRQANTGVSIDGADTDVEVINLTIANNTNGMIAANCAPVEVRNTIFANHSGVGLQYDGCASTKSHTYNDYWSNGIDLIPLTPFSGEIFLNPLFTDLENYLVEEGSPIINAGAPGDPNPPGTGATGSTWATWNRPGASFYADDDYCATCENDGFDLAGRCFQPHSRCAGCGRN